MANLRNEVTLLNVALHGTAHHVEKMVRNYRRGKRLEALNAENRRHALRELNWYVDDDGWVFKGRFSPEQGALIAKARTIPPAIRRALQRRDGGCRFLGCSCSRFVDAHHIVHWADGGETSMDNLVLLCRSHHRLVHEGGFGVHRGAGQEIWFSYPTGDTPPASADGRYRGNSAVIRVQNRNNGLDIGPRTLPPRWGGEVMDYDYAQSLLQQWE